MSETRSDHNSTEQDEALLEQLRAVILGEDQALVSHRLREDAREMVADIITEAIHDRQRQDDSIHKVLQPIVESSVDASVNNRSDKMVSSLYPLVGSLVRKSVAAFLTDFMEKTNQLLENSLTLKGLSWRFRAWQSGVSFAQYVASQTFVYRVEHILLIHRETGLLLGSVDQGTHPKGDSDLISAMLTAINDFVGDSFSPDISGQKENLNTVSTDNLNLLIRPGPQALVVAAVTGNPPQSVTDQLQTILEDIHSLYHQELQHFEGDASPFSNCEPLLRDGLLEEQKAEATAPKKSHWKAWLLLGLMFAVLSVWSHNWWQKQRLLTKLQALDSQPGIVLLGIDRGQGTRLKLLRDPDAIPVSRWLMQQNLSESVERHAIGFQEHRHISLDPAIIKKRIGQVLSSFPGVQRQWQNQQLILTGEIRPIQRAQMLQQLRDTGLEEQQLDLKGLTSDPLSQKLMDQQGSGHAYFSQARNRINALQLDFDKGTAALTPAMLVVLEELAAEFSHLKTMSQGLERHIGLLIIGVSDSSGNRKANEALSILRAQNTQTALETMGVSAQDMFTSGLGQLDMPEVANASRKVLFNVLYIDKPSLEQKEVSP